MRLSLSRTGWPPRHELGRLARPAYFHSMVVAGLGIGPDLRDNPGLLLSCRISTDGAKGLRAVSMSRWHMAEQGAGAQNARSIIGHYCPL